MSPFIFHEKSQIDFNRDGHTGKFFGTNSEKANHLIVETETGLEVSLTEEKCEFAYYILRGSGTFIINNSEYPCVQGDLVVIPPGNTFTYKGTLKMLLINTPRYTPDQETVTH